MKKGSVVAPECHSVSWGEEQPQMRDVSHRDRQSRPKRSPDRRRSLLHSSFPTKETEKVFFTHPITESHSSFKHIISPKLSDLRTNKYPFLINICSTALSPLAVLLIQTYGLENPSHQVSQWDQGDSAIDVDLLISSIQERGPLWDSRDPRHMDQVVLRRLWAEVAKSLWDGFDSASAKDKGNFLKKLRTRWRSMKDRFNKGIRAAEEQARSGAAASKSVPYKYNRALQFLRPILGRRQTHSSTLERARPAGADLHESPSDPSQPSHSDSRLAPPSGEPAAGPSGVPLPEASGAPSFGNSRQRQRASDRPAMPEFMHLSTVFQNCFKALNDKMDTRLSNIERRLENLEAELSNPAKHFLNTYHSPLVAEVDTP
ncbi:uncharacterized protein LOC143817623 [Ranitomeya variabilis]|uniref:uncharacterized protein LOC143817623 n=1 Tax=Ranitomeya variabilis TaxID=490064 RepID=UPI00405715CF